MGMTCRECLERYSDYLDERMDAAEMVRTRAHLERCPSCARYHRVMTRGLELVRALPPVEPSSGFHERLERRIRDASGVEPPRRRSRRRIAAGALAAAALVAAVLWSPTLRGSDARASSIVAMPEHLGRDFWYTSPPSTAMPVAGMATARTLTMAAPGPYSPLIVEPPVPGGRVGRAIFASHLHTLE